MSKRILKFSTILFIVIILISCSNNYRTVKSKLIEKPKQQKKIQPIQNNLSEGLTLLSEYKYDKALIYFKQRAVNHSDNWETNYYIGLCLTGLENYTEAEKHLFQSLKNAGQAKENRARIYTALGENYELRNMTDKAAQHYHTALNLNPDSEKAAEGLKRLKPISQTK